MKRIFVLLALAALLAAPSLAPAADLTGGYAALKIVPSRSIMDVMKVNMWDGRTNSTGSFGTDNKSTLGGSLALGYGFSKRHQIPIRTELEYTFFSEAKGKRDFGAGSGFDLQMKHQIHSLFMNVYYDIDIEAALTPYVSAGVGVAVIDAKGSTEMNVGQYGPQSVSFGTNTSTNLAWNIGVGAGYRLTDYVSVDLGYRFAGFGKARTKTSIVGFGNTYGETEDIYMHQVLLGLRVNF